MIVRYSPAFLKIVKKKKNVRIRKDFHTVLELFYKNPYDKKLDNHELKREWEGYRSIDVNADWRALYKERGTKDDPIAYFLAIGTHEELYKKD